MLPLTLSAASKLANILNGNSAFHNALSVIASSNNTVVPFISAENVLLSSGSSDLGDLAEQFTYPRMAIYCSSLENSHLEKFRSISGSVSVIAEIWSSGNFVSDPDSWIHFYVDAFTTVIQANIGDWGDGIWYPGTFDVQIQPPRRGGFGFVRMARVQCHLLVGRS